MDTLLEAMNIRRVADDGAVLLNDVSFRVPAGSSTAIGGPPGSGKTLLLRALAFLDGMESGDVLFRGEPVADHDVPPFRRRVVLVPQRAVLIEGTVHDNLTLPFQLVEHADRRFDEERIAGLLGQLGRDRGFLTRISDDLSGGEAQIVALLRALQLDPNVLLLDEPTSSLDEPSAAAVEKLLSEWQAADGERAVVIVTHAPEQAARIADRTVHMDGGSLVSTGDAA